LIIETKKAAMQTFLFVKRRRVQLIWPCILAAVGCLIFVKALAQGTSIGTHDKGTTASTATNQNPTYLRDIQPIFMGNCSRCHNQQSQFIYNWLDYKTAYADRWELRRRIWDSWKGSYYKEAMPVANSPESLALTDEQRIIIRNWADDGGLRGVPPPPGAAKSKAERIELGRRLFTSICAACHQPTGRGLPNVFPPLAGSDYLNADKNRAIQTVIFGRQGEVVVNGMKFNNNMPSFPLNDQDIANVLSFVYSSFGNSGLEVTPEEVKTLRAQPPDPSKTPVPKSIFE
jgi:mono/diheme cytochrome c family protein